MKTAHEIKMGLKYFTGSGDFRLSRCIMGKPYIVTDGVSYVFEQCSAYWLFDVITSYLSTDKRLFPESDVVDGFMCVKLVRKKDEESDDENNSFDFTIEDGNGGVLVKQHIPYSDFPLDDILFFIEIGMEGWWTILLPSEH